MVIKLPEQFEKGDLKFNVLVENSNDIIGTGQVDEDILTVTFNQNVNSMNNIRGKISLTRTIGLEYYSKDGIDLKFEYSGKTIVEHIESIVTDLPEGMNFFKYGYTGGKNNNDLFWGVTINPYKKEFNEVVIEDKLGEGQKFIKDSFIIIKNVNFNNKGDRVPSSDEEFLKLNDFEYEINDTEITINLGNINQGYCITYQVEKTENFNEYTNRAIMKAVGVNYTYEGRTVVENGSGTLDGMQEKGNVKLIKFDKDNENHLLEGAEFELRDSKDTLIKKCITNDKGIIEIYGLDFDTEYYFIEVKAPDGYNLNNAPINFTISREKKKRY